MTVSQFYSILNSRYPCRRPLMGRLLFIDIANDKAYPVGILWENLKALWTSIPRGEHGYIPTVAGAANNSRYFDEGT